MKKLFIFIITFSIVTSCSKSSEQTVQNEELISFLEKVEQDNEALNPIIYSASWISSNFITHDSQMVLSDYSKRSTLDALQKSKDASAFNDVVTSEENRRKLEILKTAFVMPPPFDENLASELSKIETKLSATYGSGQYCYSENIHIGSLNSKQQSFDLRNINRWLARWRESADRVLRHQQIHNYPIVWRNLRGHL